jgi:Tfp pilus assembly protein PilN
MRRHTKTALGIDLGKRHLCVALVEKSEQGFLVLAAANGDLPMPVPASPQPGYDRVLSRLLAQLGWRSYVRGARAALAFAPDSLVIQLLDMPRRMPANLGEFVGSELQQYVALSGKTVVSDFCGVGSGVQKRLLAVAADGDEIQEVTEACSRTATGIDMVEPSALAYARAFLARENGLLVRGRPISAIHPPSVNRDVLIAVLGSHTLTTTVFRRDTLDLVRIRKLPADTATPELLCGWLAEELNAVDRYYDTHASPPGQDRQICLAIHDSAHCASDIAALLATQVDTKAFAVTDVHQPLTASGAAQEDTPLEGVGPPNASSRVGDPVSLVAVGAALALLGAEGDDLRINLLPKAVAEARSLVRHVLLMAIVGVILFLGVFATAQLLTQTTGAMNRRIEETKLSEELYTASALIAEEKFLDQEIARLRQHVEPLRQILKDRQETDWPGILRVVRQATPEGVSVTQLQCSDARSASLRGLAPSCPAAEAFVRNLEAQNTFASVSLMLVQKRQNEEDRWEYRIDCLLPGKRGESS